MANEHVVIKISDNGMGIRFEDQARIFDKTFRVKNSKEGHGLGLYLVKETVNNLGGIIQVESREGLGSVFTVMLPSRKHLEVVN